MPPTTEDPKAGCGQDAPESLRGGSAPKLTFLGIGAPRCGTTWLHALLDQHPEVLVPTERKELYYFSHQFDKGLGWYSGFFTRALGKDAGAVKAVGEISPSYIYSETALRRIQAFNPDMRMILMIRNPVDRLISAYLFRLREGTFRGSFRKFREENPRAIELGLYGEALERFDRVFPRDQLLTLIFEELWRDSEAAVDRIAAHLNVGRDGFPKGFANQKVNDSYVPRFPWANQLAHATARWLRRNDLDWIKVRLRFLGRLGRMGFSRQGSGKFKLSEDERRELEGIYSSDVERLERWLGRRIDPWRPEVSA